MVGGFGLAPLKHEGSIWRGPFFDLWRDDTIAVDGGWRCSQMIEFPLREKTIWRVLSDDFEIDFVFPVMFKATDRWQPK